MATIVKARLKLKSGTSAAWSSANPVLLLGEPGFETDTRVLRIGNGVAAFLSLPGLKLPATGLGDLAVTQVAHMISLAGLTGLANKGVHFTGVGTMATHDQTVQARVLLAAVTQADQRAALGLGLLATASNVGFTDINGAAIRLQGEGFAASDTELPTVSAVRDYIPVALQTLNINRQSAISFTGTPTMEFIGIPSWVNRVTITLFDIRQSANSPLLVQIGTSGGFEVAGYVGGAFQYDSTTVSSSVLGFTVDQGTASAIRNGKLMIERLDENTWHCSGFINAGSAGSVAGSSNFKTLAGVLDRIRLNTILGTPNFTQGKMTISWE